MCRRGVVGIHRWSKKWREKRDGVRLELVAGS